MPALLHDAHVDARRERLLALTRRPTAPLTARRIAEITGRAMPTVWSWLNGNKEVPELAIRLIELTDRVERGEAGQMSRVVKIAIGKSGQNLGKVRNSQWKWEHFAEVVAEPHRLSITRKRYHEETSSDVKAGWKNADGFFVAGHFTDGKRKIEHCQLRSFVTFDLDELDPDFITLIQTGFLPKDFQQYDFYWHTTLSHIDNRPRVRMVILTDSDMPVDKYGPVSRILASKLDPEMKLVDKVSFRPAQIMYMPVVTKDGAYDSGHNEGIPLDWQALLDDYGTADDLSTLPKHPSEENLRVSLAKAEVPTEKEGIVGDFCRAYDIFQAIDKFLDDTYAADESPSGKPRYTYLKGSGTNTKGVEIQDGGLFAYSHHGSDPAADQLLNSFDLVRVHLFGHLDANLKSDDVPMGQRPSFKEMAKFAAADEQVKQLQFQEMSESFDDWDVDADAEEQAVEEVEAEEEQELDQDALDLIGAPRKLHNRPAKREKQAKPKTAMEAMNRRHAVVKVGGKTVILNIPRDSDTTSDITYSKKQDLLDWYAKEPKVPNPNGGAAINLAQAWMEDRGRQTFDKVAFLPGRETGPKVYNLWRGFAYEPDPTGSCQLFLDHLRHVICSGNEEHFRYLMGWLAHMIQRPHEKPGVAVVLRGRKGVGKDTVHEIMGRLFPHNHVVFRHVNELLAQFNGDQERALLLVLEEAMWGGEKSHGKLQGLITGPTMRIERKGIDSVQAEVFQRVFFSSNEQWVVPTTADERRYFILDVSEHRRGDRAYFDALWDQMKTEGYGALLHTLMTWDLTGFQLRNVPRTNALAQQTLEGLKGVPAFWYDVLADGNPQSEHEGDWNAGPIRVSNSGLYEAYKRWLNERRGYGHPKLPAANAFSREIGDMCPDRKAGQRLKSDRSYATDFPSLADCRRAFNAVMNHTYQWDEAIEPITREDFTEEDLI